MQPFLHPNWKLQVYVYIFISTPEVQDYYNIIVPNFGWFKVPYFNKKNGENRKPMVFQMVFGLPGYIHFILIKNHGISKLVVWSFQTPAIHIQTPQIRRVQWFLGFTFYSVGFPGRKIPSSFIDQIFDEKSRELEARTCDSRCSSSPPYTLLY